MPCSHFSCFTSVLFSKEKFSGSFPLKFCLALKEAATTEISVEEKQKKDRTLGSFHSCANLFDIRAFSVKGKVINLLTLWVLLEGCEQRYDVFGERASSFSTSPGAAEGHDKVETTKTQFPQLSAAALYLYLPLLVFEDKLSIRWQLRDKPEHDASFIATPKLLCVTALLESITLQPRGSCPTGTHIISLPPPCFTKMPLSVFVFRQ